MKIIFHGAAREVGKSCIEIQSQGQRYLLDSGVKFIQGGVEYPEFLNDISDIDAVFLSHAHMDHSGALPFFEHNNLKCQVYSTELTWSITQKLLKDAYHIEKLRNTHPAYEGSDLGKVKQDVHLIEYNNSHTTKDGKVKFQFFNSGHIPGGASVLLELEGKKIFYTADINTEKTNLMVPASIGNLGEIDVLIAEATYGDREHPNRKISEQGLLQSVHEAIQAGGSALVPVFGVGRSQEILTVLSALPKNIKIYLDGMARTMTETILNSSDLYVKNKSALRQIFNRVQLVKFNEREKIAKEKGCVIVTTSGMIEGGPSVLYAGNYVNEKDNYIIFTGYQTKGTRGRSLFEDHLFYNQGKVTQAKCHIRKFDFSAHYGQSAIHDLIKKVSHKNLILNHGDVNSLEAVYKYARENTKSNVQVPQIGEVLEF